MTELNEAILDESIRVSSVYKSQVKAFGPVEFPALLDLIEETGCGRILDVGCGEGSFTLELARRAPAVEVHGIDLNATLIAEALDQAQDSAGRVTFRRAVFGEDFADSGYDLILARFVVEHMVSWSDIDSFCRAAHRTLNPGGCLAVTEYYVHAEDIDDPTWLRFRTQELATYEFAGSHPRSALRLPGSLRRLGFTDVRSSVAHVSPVTVGREPFMQLVRDYVRLYAQIAPHVWTEESVSELMAWSADSDDAMDPVLLVSRTVGRNSSGRTSHRGGVELGLL